MTAPLKPGPCHAQFDRSCVECQDKARMRAHAMRSSREAECNEVVAWLVEQNFPTDWSSMEPAPRWLRQALAEAYAERDDDDIDEVLWALDQEQTWAAPSTRTVGP